MKLDGTVSIVTGAAGGIGLALVEALIRKGSRVVATDLDQSRLEAAVSDLEEKYSGSVVGLAGDCADASHIAATISFAEDSFDRRVDLYAANAGVGLGKELSATPQDWATSIDVNLMAHVRAAELLVPQWLERSGGYFLSTASAAGLLTQIGSATYSATKHAAVGFAEWLSITYGSRGVEVGCLCPMAVRTNMFEAGVNETDPVGQRGAQAVIQAGDVLEPNVVADVVMRAIESGEFLILPHPEVREYYQRKGSDHERWLRGMRRYQESLTQ